jgi:hypothetical protein
MYDFYDYENYYFYDNMRNPSYFCISCGKSIEWKDIKGYCIKLDEKFCSICCEYYIEDEEYFNERFGFKLKIDLIESRNEENYVYKKNNTNIYILLNILSSNFKTFMSKSIKKNIMYSYENHVVVKKHIKGSHIFNNENEAKIFMRRINFCLFLKSINNEDYEKIKALFILDKFIISFL